MARLLGVRDPWEAEMAEHLFSTTEAVFFPHPPDGWRDAMRRRWDKHARIRKLRFHARYGEWKGVKGVFCWADPSNG